MPADTDRPDLTTEQPPPASAPRRPVWPITAGIVLLGLLLLGWEVAVAVVSTAPFFGETPSRDRYVEAGMLLATSVVPVALLCLLGWLLGSRWGLALLALPGAVAVAMGVDLMGRVGGEPHPDRDRPVRLGDALQDLTRPNWLATVLLLVAVGLLLWRRRRQSVERADP
jgi:hypothetical protein